MNHHANAIADARRQLVVDPQSVGAYSALANAAGASGDLATMGQALLATFLITKPTLELVHVLIERLLLRVPGARIMSLLWRLAEENYSYPHEELFERRVAVDPLPGPSARRNYLNYLFRGADLREPSLPFVVCGMPKSASTFVSGLVAEMTNLPIDTPHNWNDFIGTGFDKGRMRDLCQINAVVHGHLAANPRTLCYFRLLGARPIITIRNIFDALRSYADHMAPSIMQHYADPNWIHFSVMRMAALYIEFFASWSRARDRIDTLWVDFDEIKRDTAGLVDRISTHLGPMGTVPGGIERARAMAQPDGLSDERKRSLMFNKGVAGRGREFNDTQRAVVRAIYPIYPDVDFRPIDPDFDGLRTNSS